MSGATRPSNYFWICHRSKRTQTDGGEIITHEEIQQNMIETTLAKENLRYMRECADQMLEIWNIFDAPRKRDSIKKRFFRRFFPWKQAQK